MIFNSFSYAGFLIVVFMLYWFAAGRSFRMQNVLLLAGSYFFYGLWDWRFLFLLTFSIVLDFFIGFRIYKSASEGVRKIWLIVSVVTNLGLLGFFKYFNFFIESASGMLHTFGMEPNLHLLNIILPIGISFYTFHGLSYVFDIYNRRIVPVSNIIDYSLFVSFFPLLVAGPIERATHLLPQITKRRTFDAGAASDGLRQILWGLFKKMIIADNCSLLVDDAFAHPDAFSGLSLIAGAVFFAFQIYSDFSGYSDIALGSAKLFGFELLRNFNYPYFSRNIAEFWSKWHISLTSWFKDYVYIPLGGNRNGVSKTIRNTIIVFLLSGIWHGANWTFVIWALYHAMLFIVLLILGTNKKHKAIEYWPADFIKIIITFTLVTLGWVFFRADSIGQAFHYLTNIVHQKSTGNIRLTHPETLTTIIFIGVLLLVEWFQKNQQHALSISGIRFPKLARFAVYTAIIICLVWYGGKPEQFIYFQF